MSLIGQSRNLETILQECGPPSVDNKYLFNGDFVDRGPNSLEVIVTLMSYKVVHPQSVLLLRGNHESDFTTKDLGFGIEITTRLSKEAYGCFSEFFKALPLACVVGGQGAAVFVLHGGVPVVDRQPVGLEDMMSVDRHIEPVENTSIVTQMLWNDPDKNSGVHDSKRGKWGLRFGPDITDRFLKDNKLDKVVRSHEEIHSTEVCHENCHTGMQRIISVVISVEYNTESSSLLRKC